MNAYVFREGLIESSDFVRFRASGCGARKLSEPKRYASSVKSKSTNPKDLNFRSLMFSKRRRGSVTKSGAATRRSTMKSRPTVRVRSGIKSGRGSLAASHVNRNV